MGHGNKFLIQKNKELAKQSFEEGVEWSYSIYRAIASFAESIYKDTDSIIGRNEHFFSSIENVDEIVTLGLSFGDVDVPYLQRIMCEIKPQTKWYAYYFTLEDKERLKNVFGILGITRNFQVYFLHSDKFWDV